MATQTTDIPFSSTTTKSRAGSDNLEAEAIGLEVPVRVNGTQLTSVMGTTEHAEPFEEDTSTMIVFPRGAVVKLLARVRAGQTVALTNLRTHAKATCKIFQVNSANKDVHYVKLEFSQAAQGFWGIHFPSEPLPVSRKPEPASPAAPNYSASTSFVDPVSIAPAAPAPAPSQSRDIFSHAAVPQRPVAPLLNENPAPAGLAKPASPAETSAYASPLAPPADPRKELAGDELKIPSIVPSVAPPREIPKAAPKFEPPKEAPLPTNNSGYGLARNWQKEQIEPLAGATSDSSVESAVAALVETPAPARLGEPARLSEPAPVEEKIPIPGRRPHTAPARRGDSPKSERSRSKPVRPVFGELHSFSPSPSASAAPALQNANIAMSSVAHSVPNAPRSRSKSFSVLAAVAVLVVIAAGVTYVRRQATLAANSSTELLPADKTLHAPAQPQPANPPQGATPQTSAPAETSSASSAESSAPNISSAAPSSDSTLPARNVAPAPKNPPVEKTSEKASEKSSKVPAETHAASKNSATNSNESTATVIPNLYAGDLNARPEIKKHAVKQLDAQAPDITVTAPGGAPVSGDAASLGSIVPGADSGAPALAAPAPEIRQGGNVQEPKLIASVPPVYPSLAQQNHVEGDVTIQAMIGISGNVTSMKVISGPVMLRDAALNALRKWRYLPAKLDGKPIAQQYLVTIRFRLAN